MLEKLYPLPDKIDKSLMLELATKSLILLRECYKKGIPWICRLDHMMIDTDGNIKFIDFNDEPVPDCPFYGYEGEEAIIMEGLTDDDGIYLDRGKYPRSGWWAIMSYLIKKNSLDIGILYEAEYRMVEREYQALKDVHQPIFTDEYKDILRTETEQNDHNFGKLVKPNRACVDRAEMIVLNNEPDDGETWLDIGCNVGWFCFYFDNLKYQMTGIDFDPEKIEFCKMMAQDQKANIEFKHDVIDIESVQAMPNYDIISALSTLHLKLVKDKDILHFERLLKEICSKANNVFYFEFPPHAYGIFSIATTGEFMEYVKKLGGFEEVKLLGMSDANRPVIKCIKP
jgi:SAM-dependent methyltransferase